MKELNLEEMEIVHGGEKKPPCNKTAVITGGIVAVASWFVLGPGGGAVTSLAYLRYLDSCD